MNDDPSTRETPSSAVGASLAAAREAAGLSIDAVAQQLKLAPRQVRAIETGDYTSLPGRTFVRGFIRNYARLLRLDAETLLRELPAAASSPALEIPTLQPTAPTIGELPAGEHARGGWARWAIPIVLAAVVIGASVYEWLRSAGAPRDASAAHAATTAEPSSLPAPVASASLQAAASATSMSPPPPRDTAASTLPNPLTGATAAADTSAPPAGSEANGQAPRVNIAAVGAPLAAAAAAPGVSSDATLVLSFRDYSWTEIRDRDGHVIYSRMNPGGSSQTISGTPPLALVIGNASDVRVVYNHRPVDLTPHIRQNVARFTLE